MKTEVKILLEEMVYDLKLPMTKAAKLLNISYATAQAALDRRRKEEKSKFYKSEPCDIELCSICGSKMWLEEIPMDQGRGYLIPAETGKFDLVCCKGHRFQCSWTAALEKARKEKEHGLQATAPARHNAGISLRREKTPDLGDTLDSSAEAGRKEMQMPHRRSWRSYAAEQRGQRDNECSSHQGGIGVDEPEKGDRA